MRAAVATLLLAALLSGAAPATQPATRPQDPRFTPEENAKLDALYSRLRVDRPAREPTTQAVLNAAEFDVIEALLREETAAWPATRPVAIAIAIGTLDDRTGQYPFRDPPPELVQWLRDVPCHPKPYSAGVFPLQADLVDRTPDWIAFAAIIKWDDPEHARAESGHLRGMLCGRGSEKLVRRIAGKWVVEEPLDAKRWVH